MSARQTILRASVLAFAGGAGLAVAMQTGLIATPGQAQQADPVILSAGPSTPRVELQSDTTPDLSLNAGPVETEALAAPDTDVQTLVPAASDNDTRAPLPREEQAVDPVAPAEQALAPQDPEEEAPPAPESRDQATGPTAAPDTAHAVSPLGLPCGLTVASEAMPGAMVALDVMDPCRPDMRVEILHAGLTITAETDSLGLLTLDIPAFETPAFFTVRLADGAEEVTLTGLPDLVTLSRVAVTWEEDRELELHAFERGAEFGAAGHVWKDTPGSVADATIGTGGFLTTLGDPTVEAPRLVQVYSFPRDLRNDLALSVDIPITEGNCGQTVRAQTVQIAESGTIMTNPVTLTIPGCEAVGDYLVLQNLFEDLRLASN
jgi:hypothetical protein